MQRIGILRGGVGDEYYFSLESGARVMEALRDSGYDVLDMLIDQQGVLHIKGIPSDLNTAKGNVDMIWNTLHGYWGEDGGLQQTLDALDIPYTGSGQLASALTYNKISAKERAQALGIKTPEVMLINPEIDDSVSEVTKNIYRRMAPPWVVKPLRGGASIRTYFAFTPLELSQFVEESISHGEPFIVEQYIYGREAVVGVIDDFRGQKQYTLPVVEINSPRNGILSHDMRKSDDYVNTEAKLRPEEKDALADYARKLHTDIGAEDFSQSDFIVDNHGKIWYLETDTAPHMGHNNAFVKGLKSVGSSIGEFVKSVIGRKKVV